MIDINRIYGLDINLDRLAEFNPSIEFKQYDYKTSFIAFRFYKDEKLIENIGDNYIIGIFKDKDGGLFVNEDGTPIRTYAFNYEEEKGIVILPISREVINKEGSVACEIIIINRQGNKITSPRFNFTIHPSLHDYRAEEPIETVCGTFRAGEKICGFGNAERIDVSKYITYEKTVWVDGETVVNQERLNNMEEGIYNISQRLNELGDLNGGYYEGDEPPEDTSLIWFDTTDRTIDKKLDSIVIDELKSIILTLSSEIVTLRERVEYLWNNQGNGGSLPSEGDSILTEDGSYLLLEDGSRILLEFE